MLIYHSLIKDRLKFGNDRIFHKETFNVVSKEWEA